MRVLLVHPSGLLYSEVYLRLEPLGLECVGSAIKAAGHDVRLLDLQIFTHDDFRREVSEYRPDAIGFSLNYLANVPEFIDLAKVAKQILPETFVFAGGHSISFVAGEVVAHGAGAIDAIIRGEGEITAPAMLDAIPNVDGIEGVTTARGAGPNPQLQADINQFRPARELTRKRKKYFIGQLDPCASIEFTRGCPWDCSFCSAWTFYGRSYRVVSPEKAAEDLARVREPGIFIVDDVAFIRSEHGFEIGREIERRNIKKKYYLETRADVLLRNKEVFAYWRKLGLEYMFLGLEAIDAEGLERYRKRSTLDINMEALEYARSLDIMVAVNLIVDPSWDADRFRVIREWAQEIPDIVHLTVNTPYPGTETWATEDRELTTRDYRLFDIQHAVLPTTLPLAKFYEELVNTQKVLASKHLGWAAFKDALEIIGGHLLRGQTNFIKMLWKFNKVYNAERQVADHQRPVKYPIRLPEVSGQTIKPRDLYIHKPQRVHRKVDRDTEQFVAATR